MLALSGSLSAESVKLLAIVKLLEQVGLAVVCGDPHSSSFCFRLMLRHDLDYCCAHSTRRRGRQEGACDLGAALRAVRPCNGGRSRH